MKERAKAFWKCISGEFEKLLTIVELLEYSTEVRLIL